MLGLKLIHVSKMGHWCSSGQVISWYNVDLFFLSILFEQTFLNLILTRRLCVICVRKDKDSKCIGYDYTAYINYMDLAVRCPRMAVRFNHSLMMTSSNGKKCPRYWPFVRGIHRSPVNSPHKGQ